MTKETIVVEFPAKYGPRVNGEFYNIDQKSGLKPEQFEKGKTYTVLINISKTGRKYITQIVAEEVKLTPSAGNTGLVIPDTTVKPGDDKLLEVDRERAKRITGTRDFDAETAGKIACACICAAVSSPGLAMYATSLKEYVQIVKDTAEGMIEKVVEHQKSKKCLKD